MAGRIFLRNVAIVAVLYVLLSMAAALARFPGQQSSGDDVYLTGTSAVADESGELRTEDIVP